LLSLPALLSNGLLSHNQIFTSAEGYYSIPSILLSLAFSFLLRIESIEKISNEPPGELGKLIGLDRIPEIKTLRTKIADLSATNQSQMWLAELSKQWMDMHPDLAGVLYIDGHQNIFYGKKNNLPARYISRMRLCMSATTDYWVCDKLGQPFFSISKSVSGSMIELIKQEIIPRLEKDVPNQPDVRLLLSAPHLHRFMIVYDRECYSLDFIIDMWGKRIACLSYNKYVKDLWPEEEFTEYEIVNDYGEKEKIKLAERGILIESHETEALSEAVEVIELVETQEGKTIKITHKRTKPKNQMWIREVRKLTDKGHQTSILSSNFTLSLILIGYYMFARWNQENFFKYMIEHYGLDMLISHFLTPISDTQQVVNPAYREQEKQIRSMNAKLKNIKSKFGQMHYNKATQQIAINEKEAQEKEMIKKEIQTKDTIDKKVIEKAVELKKKDKKEEQEFAKFMSKKANLQEDIAIYQEQLNQLKAKRKEIPTKIPYSQLPESEKFKAVYNERKQLVDTIKMICARSELATGSLIKKDMSNPRESRALIEQFFNTNGDIMVDNQNKNLRICLHHQATRHEDLILEKLCNYLNETETVFPGSDLKLHFCLV